MGELRIFDLKTFIDKHKLTTFIETGTGAGDGLRHALKYNFKQFYSIEIMKILYDKLILEFTDPRVKLINSSSLDGLARTLADEIYTPCLFWMDAHFPGADFHIDGYSYHDELDKSIKLPLEEELKFISQNRPENRDVFIIDDLNLYEDGCYECGNIREDLKYMREKYNLNGIDFIKKLFPTHKLSKIARHQGFIILEPNDE